eukprot:CAMPEP_0195067532 /NCGR_PEP_ID=MMETSP0448-20130528/12555_1 /TAXON_ID=66468 /ORGANISM="Heterocapsa triquestra, Strain CCMP 448" /LENGTH=101 /DNA_ID=CAMNT_0040098953 /DNA_START=1 /DNA_END=306 /DNA_ORIENTATION=-
MCPKETRATATWHVVASPAKVVLETATMSLDVPYGTSFQVVVCDTFTATESGTTRMVRTWGVAWVKSCFMKSLVEANVPIELEKSAHRMIEVLKEWNNEWF